MNNDCDRVKELLSPYLDNEISKNDKIFVEKHLLQCPECREEKEALEAIIKQLNTVEIMPLPTDFKEKLHKRLIEQPKVIELPKKKWHIPKYRTQAALIAGFLITILLGVGYYNEYGPSEIAYIDNVNLNHGTTQSADKQDDKIDKNNQSANTDETSEKAVEPNAKSDNVEIRNSNINTTNNAVTGKKQNGQFANTDEHISADKKIPNVTEEPVSINSTANIPEVSDSTAVIEKSATMRSGKQTDTVNPTAPNVEPGTSIEDSQMFMVATAPVVIKQYTVKTDQFDALIKFINESHTFVKDGDSYIIQVDNDAALQILEMIQSKFEVTVEETILPDGSENCIIKITKL